MKKQIKPTICEKTIAYGPQRWRIDSKGNWSVLMFGWWPFGDNPRWEWSGISLDKVPKEVKEAVK